MCMMLINNVLGKTFIRIFTKFIYALRFLVHWTCMYMLTLMCLYCACTSYALTHKCTYLYAHVHIHTLLRATGTPIYMYMKTYHTRIYTLLNTHIHAHTHIHSHYLIHMHAHTHTCTHTRYTYAHTYTRTFINT